MCLVRWFLVAKFNPHRAQFNINSPQHDYVCSIVVELEGPGRLNQQGKVLELEGQGSWVSRAGQ